jgi:hypothetical protein
MKKKNSELSVKPWCPFCGMDVGRTTDSFERKLTEFPVGKCDCGAIYVCDATGHNIGAAMVECLVYACGDDWDLAWELIPEDDYLTGRIENYDDQQHRVVDTGNMDGRAIRGVLYFVRLHKDMADVAQKVKKGQVTSGGQVNTAHTACLPDVEPARDPKRIKKRASKKNIKELVQQGDVDQLVDYCLDDRKTLRFMQRLLYEPVEAERYYCAWMIGKVCARVATREPGPVADLLHRLFEACSDSAATSWGMVETIGSIVAARPDIYGAFTRHLLNFLGDESTQAPVIWALGEIASTRPDLIRKVSFYSTFQFLEHADPLMRGLTVRLLGRIHAKEASFQVMGLQKDQNEITIYEQGRPVQTTVAQLAYQAVKMMHNLKNGEKNSE